MKKWYGTSPVYRHIFGLLVISLLFQLHKDNMMHKKRKDEHKWKPVCWWKMGIAEVARNWQMTVSRFSFKVWKNYPYLLEESDFSVLIKTKSIQFGARLITSCFGIFISYTKTETSLCLYCKKRWFSVGWNNKHTHNILNLNWTSRTIVWGRTSCPTFFLSSLSCSSLWKCFSLSRRCFSASSRALASASSFWKQKRL